MTVPEHHAVQACPTLPTSSPFGGTTRLGWPSEPSGNSAQTDRLYRIAAILAAALLLTTVL